MSLLEITDFVVEVRNANLDRVGVIKGTDLDITATPKVNGVGYWMVNIREGHPMAAELRTPGAGIIITDKQGDVFLSGPVTDITDTRSQSEAPTLIIEGISDDHVLDDALCWPDPTNGNVAAQAFGHDVRTGAAETLMHQYVRNNIGPSGSTARRVPRLKLGNDEGRGSTVTKRPRFIKLIKVLRDLANSNKLTFRVVQRGDALMFETYERRDLASKVRLTVENGRLAEQTVVKGAPDLTRAIVAGSGSGKKRKMVEVYTTDSESAEEEWHRRIETFVDQRGTLKTGELYDAGVETLVNGGGESLVGVKAIPADDAGDMKYGRDWTLGDKVTVEVSGVERTVSAVGAVLKASETGFSLGFVLGDPRKAHLIAVPMHNVQTSHKHKKKKKRKHKPGTKRASWAKYGFDVDARVAHLETADPSRRTGVVEMYAGTELPEGALWCDGTVYNIDDYPELAAILGNTWGGDGVTTFAVPSMRNRLPVGVGNNYALGDNEGRTQASRSLVPEISYSTQSNTSTGGSATRVNNINNAANTELPHMALNFIINV